MEPTAAIYSSRFSLKWAVPFVLAGVVLLSGGALLGNYLGQQAAASRSVALADWSSPQQSVVTVIRKRSLLRGTIDDRIVQARSVVDPKDQDRIAPARTVIGVPKTDVRRKNNSLASLVPMAPEVDGLIGKSPKATKSAKLTDRLGTDEEARISYDLPDQPMPAETAPLPGELVRLDDPKVTGVAPMRFDGIPEPPSAQPSTPTPGKLAEMARRGKKARTTLVAQRKHFAAEQLCMAKAIYFEARGEPAVGQMAVAGVVMNRVRSRRYPNTVCKVVFQNEQWRNACQFSFACDGKPEIARNKRQWRRAQYLAKAFITGKKKAVGIRRAMYYHADYVKPKWARQMRKVKTIGRHIFYERRTRVASR